MSFIGKWKDKIAHYIDLRISIVKLSFIERTSGILSYLIYIFTCLSLALAMLLFMGIGLAEWLATVVDSKAGGFFITSGIFLLLILLLAMLRKSITKAFASVFVRIMTQTDDDDDDDRKDSRDKIKVD